MRCQLIVWLGQTTLMTRLSPTTDICMYYIINSFKCYLISLQILSFRTMEPHCIMAEQYKTFGCRNVRFMDRTRRFHEFASKLLWSYSSWHFSLSFVKKNIFRTSCNSLLLLKRRMTSTIRSISTSMLQNIRKNMKIRISVVIWRTIERIENMI